MRRPVSIAAAFLLLGTACLGGGGGDERTVLVDYNHDEFATIMVDYFPGEITVTPGMSVVFKQTWTGEPHTVTGGTLVDEMMEQGKPLIDFFNAFEHLAAMGGLPNPEEPEGPASALFEAVEASENRELKEQFNDAYDALREAGADLPDRSDPGDASFADVVKAVDDAEGQTFESLPTAWDEAEGDPVTQNAGQPCFLTKGSPPKQRNTPCADDDQSQPVFNGKQSYYNSGIIPYEGPQGNTFRVQLAQDIDPGTYFFYCAVHGPGQSTAVEVKPAGTKIPSQTEVSRAARKEIDDFAKPMVGAWRDGRDGRIEMDGQTIRGPFAGLSAPVFGAINEFVPKTIETKVGEEVTWKVMGWVHTISFDVPPYFPVIRFARNGKVSLNPQLLKAAGGAPEPQDSEEPIVRVDGGTWDGSGFYSTGLIAAEQYVEFTLRFSKAGTYKYACLLHPPMVGTVEVT